MDFEVVCYVNAAQNLYHGSLIYTGLCELEKSGVAKVRFQSPRPEKSFCVDKSHIICAEVKCTTRRTTLLVAMDLSDHSDAISMVTLQHCDVYLKRSYYSPDLMNIPNELRHKIIPFGLNFSCRSAASAWSVLGKLVPQYSIEILCAVWRGFRSVDGYGRMLRQYLTTPDIGGFERDPDEIGENVVLFQTRVWQPGEDSDNIEEINQERVALVRALKRAFGKRFKGGLVPTDFAKERYPAEVSSHEPRHAKYIAWSRSPLIGINSRGLHHSIAFKLGEYFASSKCIVTCALRNELPVPLVDGQTILIYKTPEECVQHCADLLNDPQRMIALRREAWSYYLREIKPSAHVRNCLFRAAGNPTCRGVPSG